MLAAKDLQSIAHACIAVANDVADASGFVPIRKLLARFDVSLIIRPLLVEGMLASLPAQRGESSLSKMTVLIDSETFHVGDKEVAMEAATSPLPPRFRTTVAHELLHSLAFRPSAFGLRLEKPMGNEQQIREAVKAIEQETERLTPLLLWPERALDELLTSRSEAISPSELANISSKLGLSRQIAINRLRLRALKEGIVYAPWLRDVAIGIAEWADNERAVFRKWPLFVNFDQNVVPSFIHTIASQDRLPASSVFEEEHFAMRGGQYNKMSFLVDAGLKESPKIEMMPVVVSVEDGLRRAGTEFFFVVRKKRRDDGPSSVSQAEADGD